MNLLRKWKWIAAIAGAGLFLYLSPYLIGIFIYIFPVGDRLAEGVNKEGLLSLRPGMTGERVVELIGEPLYKVKGNKYFEPVVDKSSGAIVSRPTQNWLWVYGDPGLGGAGYEAEVKMSKDHRLLRAYVELSDLGVYRCDVKECPIIWKPNTIFRL